MENLSIVSYVKTDKDADILRSLRTGFSNLILLKDIQTQSEITAPQSSNLVFLFDSQSLSDPVARHKVERHLQTNKQCLHFCLIVDVLSSSQIELLSAEFFALFHDLIFWPCEPIELMARISRFKEADSRAPNDQRALLQEFSSLNLIGESKAFTKTLTLIKKVASCDAPVLIQGETGTGKENAARAIHYLGSRSNSGFVPINCGALPDELLESELFGHCKGAFTDAKEKQEGLAAIANGGTLFLDEIDSLSSKAQSALLRFLQTGEYRPLGSKTNLQANVRIIAASNANLCSLVKTGRFREDLLFRLNVLHVAIPPLRERQGDIEILAAKFIQKYSEAHNTQKKRLTTASIQWLKQQDWPGNVRELENTLLRYFLLSEGNLIHIGCVNDEQLSVLNQSVIDQSIECGSFQAEKAAAIRQFEQSYLQNILRQTGGNVSEAARVSGKERRALGKLLQKYHIEKEQYFSQLESF